MIAHVDADAFFASVLQRKHPRLCGKPLLALGMGGGCVIAASYEAKAFGVKTGMRLTEALRLCPHAVHVLSDFRETGIASDQIGTILRDHCPVMEQTSIDEWFLDLTTLPGGLPKDLETWAKVLQSVTHRSTGLTVSVGIAPTKLLAKMASEYRKPAGITIVAHSMRDAKYKIPIPVFLQSCPAAAIPGIGRRRTVHTDIHGWKMAWDIATAPTEQLLTLFGKPGLDMQRELRGEAVAQVTDDAAPPKSLSRCRSFRRTSDTEQVWASMLRHLSYLVLKLRRHHLAARGISAWVRDDTYSHGGTQRVFSVPLRTEEAMTPFLQECFQELCAAKRVYTQAGVGLWQLCSEGTMQFSLFREPTETVREERLQASLDQLRSQFGRDIIGRGSALSPHRDIGRYVLPAYG